MRPCSSRCLAIFEAIICLSTLQRMHVREIGRYISDLQVVKKISNQLLNFFINNKSLKNHCFLSYRVSGMQLLIHFIDV